MIEVVRGSDGNIIACLEWYLVDVNGNFDIHGSFVWIEQYEISDSHKQNGILGISRKILEKIIAKAPTANFGYFKRQKYNGRVRLFHKRHWIRLLSGGKNEQTI